MTSASPLLSAATAPTTAAPTASTSTNLISPSDFMSLLVSQLKNQDPTQPMDPNAFMNQLVGFNSLETQLGMKQDLDTLASAISANAAGSSSSNTTTPTTPLP
jgi:flagellar basal-body rod modification protein FlgD